MKRFAVKRHLLCTGLLALAACGAAHAQRPATPDIQFVWMGGNDCPPCVAWRQTELPKLQRAPEFAAVRFSYVVKTITSSVPSSFFLPSDVKPLKDKLDVASNRLSGSPHGALVVNGEVYDYFFGTRTAEEILGMIRSARDGTPYPLERCPKLETTRKCAVSVR